MKLGKGEPRFCLNPEPFYLNLNVHYVYKEQHKRAVCQYLI